MKRVDESLIQFRDNKFFGSLLEADAVEKEELSPAEKEKLKSTLEKQGMAVVKKCMKNFNEFKKFAGDIWQEYRDFWKTQEDADETTTEKGMYYNLFRSDYVVGVIKEADGTAYLKVFNTSVKDENEWIAFKTKNKDVVRAFVDFVKNDVEGTMKAVISKHKEKMAAKKAADEAQAKQEKEASKKAKLDAFLGESETKNLNERYKFKEDSGSGRSTYVLILDENDWKKVEHLFDDKGRPINKNIQNIPFKGNIWTLYSQQTKYMDGSNKYKIYGVSGDYTFGNAPTYYQQKLRGNKKAAFKILNWFIENYLDNRYN